MIIKINSQIYIDFPLLVKDFLCFEWEYKKDRRQTFDLFSVFWLRF